MTLTISGYSTALFSTWYFIEELGLLFDCGDGMMSAMLQKSRKIENIFISHPDRDHITGLLQVNQLNAREGFPIIHYPKDSKSFPALRDFSVKFDPHVVGTVWRPLADRERVWIKKDVYVEALRNNHVPAPAQVIKSFGFKVVQVRYKLKAAYLSLPPLEIKKVIDHLGREATHILVETVLLCYTGDTPAENFEYWNNAKVLIHEATFLGDEVESQSHRNKHSRLEDVLIGVKQTNIETLILGHFSSRYSNEQIDSSIVALCRQYDIKIPVYRVLPGQTVFDILSTKPLFALF
ncbi:MBL fold metallo-hydrolase [Chitinophaga sancti]|uniref:MBL fold metallo-hydrolase n=1 Tax=Chitinophaga sancti TaxID=1004 RepID=UPI003F7A65A4